MWKREGRFRSVMYINGYLYLCFTRPVAVWGGLKNSNDSFPFSSTPKISCLQLSSFTFISFSTIFSFFFFHRLSCFLQSTSSEAHRPISTLDHRYCFLSATTWHCFITSTPLSALIPHTLWPREKESVPPNRHDCLTITTAVCPHPAFPDEDHTFHGRGRQGGSHGRKGILADSRPVS